MKRKPKPTARKPLTLPNPFDEVAEHLKRRGFILVKSRRRRKAKGRGK